MIGTSSSYIWKGVKFFYDIPEASNHWFAMYQNYHINSFSMTESICNPCLLQKYELFSIVRLQIDNTLILANNTFTAMEEEAINMVKFMTKEQAYLLLQTPIKFNGT